MSNEVILPDSGQRGLSMGDVKDLIRAAVTSGNADAVASLDKLVALAERVADRQARMEWVQAYAAFRAECPTIRRTKRGEMATRDGTAFSWWYAPYEVIRGAVDPYLARHGLSIRESSDDMDGAIRAIIHVCHVGGHSEPSTFTVRKGSANQKLAPGQQDAGTLTIALRRALAMALGIVTSEHDAPEAEPEDPTCITEQQAADLAAWVENLKGDKSKFLKWLKADSFESIRAADYGRAVDFLKSKERA